VIQLTVHFKSLTYVSLCRVGELMAGSGGVLTSRGTERLRRKGAGGQQEQRYVDAVQLAYTSEYVRCQSGKRLR